jgi:hypothetical protein
MRWASYGMRSYQDFINITHSTHQYFFGMNDDQQILIRCEFKGIWSASLTAHTLE